MVFVAGIHQISRQVFVCDLSAWVSTAQGVNPLGLFFPFRYATMKTGGGSTGGGVDRPPKGLANAKTNVAELLQRLNLTEEEGGVADFSDDEMDGEVAVIEWALLGKVLSPSAVHANTIRAAMKPAWGNPVGLKIR